MDTRVAKQQGEKPHSYRRRRTERTASDEPTNKSVRHAPYNLIKEEPSAGGAGKGLVVEGAVGVPSGIGGDGAEEAFDGDADRATDWYLAKVEEG